MAWVKVPPENQPLFLEALEALPKDPPIATVKMFGGIAAQVNGNTFAGLFGRSVMIWLPEKQRKEALALEGAEMFDPMGDGRKRSDKVMLPESMMDDAPELRRWVAKAFKATALLPPKAQKAPKKKKTAAKKKKKSAR